MDPPRHDEQRKIVSPICRVVDKKQLAPIWLRARPDTAPRFCGLEIGNAVPHHRLRGIPKGGRTASSHSAPTPSERVPGRLGGPARVASGREPRLPLGAGAASIGQFIHQPTERRARGGPPGLEITRTSEPNGRNRNGQSARLDANFRPAKLWRGGQDVARDHAMMAEFCNFSMGSTFRAIGQSPTRNALVSEIRRDCKGLSVATGTEADSARCPEGRIDIALIPEPSPSAPEDVVPSEGSSAKVVSASTTLNRVVASPSLLNSAYIGTSTAIGGSMRITSNVKNRNVRPVKGKRANA